jgi:hypothetical protein
VVFADITNAFPSTKQATLWLKMRNMGAGGHVFDWLQMLYQKMLYVVKHHIELSQSFFSMLGILIGDNSSPILWTLYMADFHLEVDVDDIKLAGTVVANLEQADDIILMSTSPRGAQKKMDALWKWCGLNFMQLSAVKSMVMVFGLIPQMLPLFLFGNKPVRLKTEQTYVGITLQSTQCNIFAKHYTNKAGKAQSVGNMVLCMESIIGTLFPHERPRSFIWHRLTLTLSMDMRLYLMLTSLCWRNSLMFKDHISTRSWVCIEGQ